MPNFLDETGLQELWNRCLEKFGGQTIYQSVTDFGCTNASSATQVWRALPKNSTLITQVNEFTDVSWALSTLPEGAQTPGFLTIRKPFDSFTRGEICFVGKTTKIGDYRMFFDGDSNNPNGTWVKEFNTGNIIYDENQPTNVAKGTFWFKPIG